MIILSMASKRTSKPDPVSTGGTAAAPAVRKRQTSAKPTKNPTVHGATAPPTGNHDVIVNHEEIARLAYALWEARGRWGGSPEEDWYRAENQLRARVAAAK